MKLPSFMRSLCPVAAVLVVAIAPAQSTRAFGTIDSFGLVRWEAFSENPSIRSIVSSLTKEHPAADDLRNANAVVERLPADIPSRALRAELWLKLNPSVTVRRWNYEQLARMNPADRFEAAYTLYHRRRSKCPERFGITTDLQKINPPYTESGPLDLEYLHIQKVDGGLTIGERILEVDQSARVGDIQHSRFLIRSLVDQNPRIWQLKALQGICFRRGLPAKLWDPRKRAFVSGKVDPNYLISPDKTLAIAEDLLRAHPECRVLYQIAGVAAMDLHKKDVALNYFQSYLAKPDPGTQGENRSRDVRELIARLKS